MTTPDPVRLPIDDGYQLTVKINQGGQVANVVMGFLDPSEGNPTQAQAQALLDAFWGLFRTHMHSGVACQGGVLRSVDGDGRVYELSAPPLPLGNQAQPASLAAASYLIKWSTATGTRSGKGRTYLPGVTEISMDNSGRAWDPTLAADFQTTINAYLDPAFGGSLFRPAVLSFTKGTGYLITGGALSAIPGVQRRRMRN